MYDVSEKYLHFFPIVPIDAESAVIYGDIASTLFRSGRRISTFDELIAAIAFRHDEPPVTRDWHFAEVEGLELISY